MLEFRGVYLLEFLLKLYTSTLVEMLRTVEAPAYTKLSGTSGFTETEALQPYFWPIEEHVCTKGDAWQELLEVHTFVGDILQAVDFLHPSDQPRWQYAEYLAVSQQLWCGKVGSCKWSPVSPRWWKRSSSPTPGASAQSPRMPSPSSPLPWTPSSAV